jgi:dTDP-4-dehydrorhamnose reductase
MSSTRKILLTGGQGQIGGAVLQLAARHNIEIVAPDRSKLDLCDEQSLVNAVQGRVWDAVINCAAYTAVDKAESVAEQAYFVNAIAPGILARETSRVGIPIIHISTDYVFDGTKKTPYVEEDLVNPLSVYGRTKEAGESAVRAANCNHAIIRTAWVMSAAGANFLNTMLKLGAEHDVVRVVHDQLGCPSNANDIADALLTVSDNLGNASGTWHFVNNGEASWYDLAAYIFAETERRGILTPRLGAISTLDYPTAAKRPANSRLATGAIECDFAIKPRHWRDAIEEVITERLKTK